MKLKNPMLVVTNRRWRHTGSFLEQTRFSLVEMTLRYTLKRTILTDLQQSSPSAVWSMSILSRSTPGASGLYASMTQTDTSLRWART